MLMFHILSVRGKAGEEEYLNRNIGKFQYWLYRTNYLFIPAEIIDKDVKKKSISLSLSKGILPSSFLLTPSCCLPYVWWYIYFSNIVLKVNHPSASSGRSGGYN